MVIHLGHLLLGASCDPPGRRRGNPPAVRIPKDSTAGRPYSVLLPVGFALPLLLPATRCALTAPFHPCRCRKGTGGLLSVALSLESPPPAVNRHRVSVEPGLSSPRRVSPLPKCDHPTVWLSQSMARRRPLQHQVSQSPRPSGPRSRCRTCRQLFGAGNATERRARGCPFPPPYRSRICRAGV